MVTFFLRQADDKNRFESPDIIRLAQVVIRESLATRCTILSMLVVIDFIANLKRVRPLDVSRPPSFSATSVVV